MSLPRLIAGQLRQPSGIVGHLFMGPLWNRRNSALNDAAFDTLALSAQDRVLEVGFGGGYLLGRISNVVTDGLLAGVDASTAMVSSCQRRYRSLIQKGAIEVSCARAESLPYPAGHFTRVCSVNSIFYWQNAAQAIAEFSRVLASGGLLVLCFTCKESLATRGFARHGLILYDGEEVQ
jgi:arsenite methyltransferase